MACAWLFMLLLVLMPTLLLVGKVRKVQASATWLVCAGTIDSSKVSVGYDTDGDPIRSADIRYRYQVDGVDYAGERVSHGSTGSVYKVVDRYPAGSTAEVHYNPTRPKDAVLLTGTCTEYYVWIGVLVIIMVAMIVEMIRAY